MNLPEIYVWAFQFFIIDKLIFSPFRPHGPVVLVTDNHARVPRFKSQVKLSFFILYLDATQIAVKPYVKQRATKDRQDRSVYICVQY